MDKLAQRNLNDEDDGDGDVNDDVEQAVMDELRRIIEDSEIMAEDDELWPQPDRVGDDITNDKIRDTLFSCFMHEITILHTELCITMSPL